MDASEDPNDAYLTGCSRLSLINPLMFIGKFFAVIFVHEFDLYGMNLMFRFVITNTWFNSRFYIVTCLWEKYFPIRTMFNPLRSPPMSRHRVRQSTVILATTKKKNKVITKKQEGI
jgi:hypothetical protein